VEGLSKRRQIHLLDYRAEHHDTLEELIDTLSEVSSDIEGSVHLLGQSIGAAMAAMVASRRPSVERVVFVGAFTRGRWATLRVASALARASPPPLYRITTRPLMVLACGPVGDGRDHPFFWHATHSDRAGSARRTRWQVGRDFSSAFSNVSQPALALLGDKDRFVADTALELGRLRHLLDGPGQKVMTVPGAGHVLLPSAAVAFGIDAIERFLE
jgi:pimeloyl-ACP methyl ester carboxylesterase